MSSTTYEEFYAHYRPFVAAYVGRRVEFDVAEDLVADVFTIAWRRRHDVPDDALPWLYKTARNVIGNRYRSASRFSALCERLGGLGAQTTTDPAITAVDTDMMVRAFASLSTSDQELVLLTAWEGLTPGDAGQVLGISEGAAAVRLHRARKRLDDAATLQDEEDHEAVDRKVSDGQL